MKKLDEIEIIDNKQRTGHPFLVWESIQSIPKMMDACFEPDVQNHISMIKQEFERRYISSLVLLGRGSSYYAALAVKDLFKKFTYLPTSCFVTNEYDAYPYEKCDTNTAVFFLSHSGKSEGDVQVVKNVRAKGAYTIGVTDILDSALAKSVDQLFIGPGGAKFEHPATRTYATAIFRMMQLAISLSEVIGSEKGLANYQSALESLPKQTAILLSEFEMKAPDVVNLLKDRKQNIIIGFGPNFANAEEAAMAFNQSSDIPTMSYNLENYIHGPIQALIEDAGMIGIAPAGKLQGRMFGLISAAKVIGAKTILLVPENCEVPDVDFVIRMPSDIPELLTPVVYMLPLWQIGYHLGLLGRGAHPDRLSMDKPKFQKALTYIMKEDKWLTKE